ncbi:MAG TPA: SRPBCC domain-containing protein [Gemmatimonadaceae bacterium]|nr:SRPBCC domain-containing protein [Gemmatimonadaceae bacterium]
MSKQKPFRVEVVIDAPRDVVWRALTDPVELRRWFGWDHPGLAEEIRFIFVDHATPTVGKRIELLGAQTIELETDGPRTIVRAVRPGTLSTAHWDDVYDAMEEGWRTFFHQLRYYLERRRGLERRTVHFAGEATPGALLAVIGDGAAERPWLESRHQRAIATDEHGGTLIALVAEHGVAAGQPGKVTITVSAYGLPDAAYDALRNAWASRWASVARSATITP